MRILALERSIEGVSDAECTAWLRPEALRAWELYRQGVIKELYFRPDTHEAVLLLECSDIQEARRILDSLPLVEHELIRFEIVPLAPYTGFERLFADHPGLTGDGR